MKLVGPPYLDYVRRTGLIFPPLLRNPAGAADMELPRPTHWQHPLHNIPGILIGVLGGVFYWALIGCPEFKPMDLWLSWDASFVVAVLGGLLYSIVNSLQQFRASQEDFDRFQVRVSTNTALISAMSIITWFVISVVRVGRPPTLGVVLPMWIVVLWVGHVSAVAISAVLRKIPTAGAVSIMTDIPTGGP